MLFIASMSDFGSGHNRSRVGQGVLWVMGAIAIITAIPILLVGWCIISVVIGIIAAASGLLHGFRKSILTAQEITDKINARNDSRFTRQQ